MASALTRSQVTEFLTVVTQDNGLELWLEKGTIAGSSPLAGHTVIGADLRRKIGAILAALLQRERGITLMPDENVQLQIGDEMFVLGIREYDRALTRRKVRHGR